MGEGRASGSWSEGNRVALRSVDILRFDDGMVLLSGGVAPGDVVVGEGSQKLFRAVKWWRGTHDQAPNRTDRGPAGAASRRACAFDLLDAPGRGRAGHAAEAKVVSVIMDDIPSELRSFPGVVVAGTEVQLGFQTLEKPAVGASGRCGRSRDGRRAAGRTDADDLG